MPSSNLTVICNTKITDEKNGHLNGKVHKLRIISPFGNFLSLCCHPPWPTDRLTKYIINEITPMKFNSACVGDLAHLMKGNLTNSF